MKTKSKTASDVMCIVAVQNNILCSYGHGKKIRTYAGGSSTIKNNGLQTIIGKDVRNRLMKHFLNSDAFISTTVRELQACFALSDDRFAEQPTRKAMSVSQLMAKYRQAAH